MGIAERREREKQQRWNDILDAAENIFFEKGFNAAKMDDVAEQAELSKGTLYLYFKNKEELYFGLTLRALTDLRNRFQKVIEGEGTGMEKTTEIGRAYYQFSLEQPEYFKTIALFEMSQLESNEEGEDVSQKCHQEGQRVLEHVAMALKTGIQDGTIRKDIEPMKTAFLLQGMSTGINHLILREGKHIQKFENFDPGQLREDFIDMVIRALTPNRKSSRSNASPSRRPTGTKSSMI